MPAIYPEREFAAAGGLMSYGATFRMHTVKPASTPAASSRARSRPTCRSQQSTKVELVINLKTAKALGLTVPAAAARPRRRGDRMMGWMAPLRHLSAKLLSDRESAAKGSHP